MEILFLTLFISLLLAAFFMLMFIKRKASQEFSCPERESLLPLIEEKPVSADKSRKTTPFVKDRTP